MTKIFFLVTILIGYSASVFAADQAICLPALTKMLEGKLQITPKEPNEKRAHFVGTVTATSRPDEKFHQGSICDLKFVLFTSYEGRTSIAVDIGYPLFDLYFYHYIDTTENSCNPQSNIITGSKYVRNRGGWGSIIKSDLKVEKLTDGKLSVDIANYSCSPAPWYGCYDGKTEKLTCVGELQEVNNQ